MACEYCGDYWDLWEGSVLRWEYNEDGSKTNYTTLCGKKFIIRSDDNKSIWKLCWYDDHPVSGSIVDIENYILGRFSLEQLEKEFQKYFDILEAKKRLG